VDWTPIIISCIGTAGLVSAAALPAWFSSKRTIKAVEAVHTEVRTNHGLTASQYLEMVADVKTTVEIVAAGQDSIVKLIADHTMQDAVNFEQIRADMGAIEALVASGSLASAVAHARDGAPVDVTLAP
jgi:hypothetical protein